MNWLKGLGISIKVAVVAGLAVMAVMAVKRQKASAEKWQDRALDIELGNVNAGTATAMAANSKAKLHESRAKEIKKIAVARVAEMGDKDEDVADILDQFRRS